MNSTCNPTRGLYISWFRQIPINQISVVTNISKLTHALYSLYS